MGTINLIFARLGSDVRASFKVMSVGGGPDLGARNQAPKRNRVMVPPTMGFSKEDKEGTFQPYDDALVVTIRIGGPLRNDKVTRTSWGRGGTSQLHRCRSLFPLYGYLGQTLASCYGCGVFNLASKVKYPIQGRVGELVDSQAMFGVSNYTAFCSPVAAAKDHVP